jgi:hypothetical protein
MSGLMTSDVPASVQAACLYDDDRNPAAQCVTFSVSCILFQVFAPGLADADISPNIEIWLAPAGAYQSALLQIAPSGSPVRWPPQAVIDVAGRELVARRLSAGLTAISLKS